MGLDIVNALVREPKTGYSRGHGSQVDAALFAVASFQLVRCGCECESRSLVKPATATAALVDRRPMRIFGD